MQAGSLSIHPYSFRFWSFEPDHNSNSAMFVIFLLSFQGAVLSVAEQELIALLLSSKYSANECRVRPVFGAGFVLSICKLKTEPQYHIHNTRFIFCPQYIIYLLLLRFKSLEKAIYS